MPFSSKPWWRWDFGWLGVHKHVAAPEA